MASDQKVARSKPGSAQQASQTPSSAQATARAGPSKAEVQAGALTQARPRTLGLVKKRVGQRGISENMFGFSETVFCGNRFSENMFGISETMFGLSEKTTRHMWF